MFSVCWFHCHSVADQPSSTAAPNPDIASATTLPLVIGGTIGGLIIISLILLVLFCRRRGCDSHRLLNMQVAYHGDNIDHMSSRERRRLRREAPCAYHSTSESDIVPPIFARLSSMDQEQRCPIHGCTTPSTSRLPETATRTPRDTDTELHPELHPVESVHREEMEEADLMRGVTEIHYPFTRWCGLSSRTTMDKVYLLELFLFKDHYLQRILRLHGWASTVRTSYFLFCSSFATM